MVKVALSDCQNVPRCNEKHILLPDKILTSWKCNYCRMTIGQKPYMCSRCDYYLCSFCYCWEGDMRASLLGCIKCPKNHQIHITGKCGVECIGCKKIYSQPDKKFNFYHCRRCRFDLCEYCVKKIKYACKQEKAKCQHGAILKWKETDFREYSCSRCTRFYEGVPCFKAESCECKLCIPCSYNMVN